MSDLHDDMNSRTIVEQIDDILDTGFDHAATTLNDLNVSNLSWCAEIAANSISKCDGSYHVDRCVSRTFLSDV